MRIIFARHGNPDYVRDCLTELGHIQARALAKRLASSGIEKIYSSSCGRAMETASYTAEVLGLSVTPCDFIREIDWTMKDKSTGVKPDPWHDAVEYGRLVGFQNTSWWEHEFFSGTHLYESFLAVARGTDEWLRTLGYERDGNYYRVVEPKYKTVALFAHAGAFSAFISHIFNLSVPFVMASIPVNQTGVFEIELYGEVGDINPPRLYKRNNISHLYDAGIEAT